MMFSWGISIRVETCGSEWNKSVANCDRSTYKIAMCFDDSLPFHGAVEIPYAYALKVAASCFENAIRYSFEVLSRRFDAAHYFSVNASLTCS
jgi:hypothetical protein